MFLLLLFFPLWGNKMENWWEVEGEREIKEGGG